MTAAETMHHPQPQYLQQQQQYQQQPSNLVPQGSQDDRSTSPTVIVTSSQVVKEGHDSNNPSPNPSTSTAPNSSTNTTPLSGAGAAASIYSSVPNPVAASYRQFSENHQQQPHQGTTTMVMMMDTIDGGGAGGGAAARPTTPSMQHYQHSHPGSRDPLSSPMSAPALVNGSWHNYSSAPTSANTTPVPSEIHTSSSHGVQDGATAPFFPSALRNSASSNSISSKSTTTNTKSVQVTGKKKHSVKSSASMTSLSSNNPADDEFLISEQEQQSGVPVTARRQKRLERNRESARLSRRRRKQYLEVLEERVSQLSLEMDKGRRDHAKQAIATIRHKRNQVMEQAAAAAAAEALTLTMAEQQQHSNNTLKHSLWLLEEGPLSRCSTALLVLSTFFMQQLKSFSLPSECKFTLWLTLQGDVYYRGGRAASERLSAARIGERMLANGNDKVTPNNSMWPLVCNEVGLSYDQEERVRQYQRTLILQDPNTWLDRHTARASSLTMQSFHDAVGSVSNVLGQRERRLKEVLSPEQRLKFLSWANRNADRLKSKFPRKPRDEQNLDCLMKDVDESNPADTCDTAGGDKENAMYRLDKSHHLAANLYILNHRLQTVLKEFPFHPPVTVTPTSLKKLSRRPSFESLGQQQKDAEGRGLSRETSFASMGSLKNSTSNLSLGGSSAENLEKLGQTNQYTPEDGEQAAAPTVDQYLGFVKPIIPPIPPPRMAALPPMHPAPSYPVSSHYAATSVSTPSFAEHRPAPAVTYISYAPPPAPELTTQPPQHYAETSQYPEQQAVQYQQPQAPAPQAPHSQHYAYQPQQPTYQQAPPPQGQYYALPIAQAPAVSAAYASSAPSPGYTHVPSPLDNLPHTAAIVPGHHHERQSSFLPQHLNVVPEDMFPAGEAEDFFVGLMDGEEDWAIGEGIDMDTTA